MLPVTMQEIPFYFDYLSPYAYFASRQIEALASRHDCRVSYRPVLFPALLDHWGQLGPAEILPKAVHTLRSCLRYARLRGIPLRSPRFHPFRSLRGLRATLAVPPERRATAVHALFAHGWADGGDLGDASEIAAALSAAGLDGDALVAAAQSDTVKRELRDATDAAIARGVFGVPTFDVAGELFWGVDQLDYIELVLRGRDPLSGVDLAALGPRGASAWRPAAPPRADLAATDPHSD
jgi:2-hydroxychromene-2-carboxylate isomerase